jgi:hypothetical protein
MALGKAEKSVILKMAQMVGKTEKSLILLKMAQMALNKRNNR